MTTHDTAPLHPDAVPGRAQGTRLRALTPRLARGATCLKRVALRVR